MGFDIKKLGQAFGGLFGKKTENKPSRGKKGKKEDGDRKSPSRASRDDSAPRKNTPEPASIRPKKAHPAGLKQEQNKGPAKANPNKQTGYQPEKTILETQRTTTKGQYLQQSALLLKAIDEGSLDRLQELLGKLGATATKLTNSGSQRAKDALNLSNQLQQAIEDKFGPVLDLSTTLARETAALSDEAMKIAARWLALSKKVVNAAEIRDLEAAKTHATELIDQCCLLEGVVQSKEHLLANFKIAFDKWLQAKDYFSLSNHAEGLARDASVLAILHPSEAATLEVPKGERLEVIRGIARQLQMAIRDRKYGTVAAYASALSIHCGLLADNNHAKATSVLNHAKTLKETLQGGEGSSEEALAGIQQHASTFTGAVLDRQKRASESLPQLKQATFSKDITALSSAANKLWRALSFTHDPDLSRANSIATQTIKLDTAIKAGDRDKAIQLLSKSL